jgi:hypothetical protein
MWTIREGIEVFVNSFSPSNPLAACRFACELPLLMLIIIQHRSCSTHFNKGTKSTTKSRLEISQFVFVK